MKPEGADSPATRTRGDQETEKKNSEKSQVPNRCEDRVKEQSYITDAELGTDQPTPSSYGLITYHCRGSSPVSYCNYYGIWIVTNPLVSNNQQEVAFD